MKISERIKAAVPFVILATAFTAVAVDTEEEKLSAQDQVEKRQLSRSAYLSNKGCKSVRPNEIPYCPD